MSIGKVAQRYATALVDLVLEKGQQATVQQELNAFAELMQQAPQLQAIFANPAINRHQKASVLDALLNRTKPSAYTKNFLRLLLKNERLHNLAEMYSAYVRALDERMGIATAHVTTARPLRQDEEQSLRTQLEKLTGRKIRVQVTTNPDLLGGVVARIGDEIYDGSIQTQLETIRRQLSQ